MQTNNLWAPWRISYMQQLAFARPDEGEQSCFFCAAAKVTPGDAEAVRQLVVVRRQHGLVMLNRYPYTNGHLLVAPLEHIGDLSDMTAAQRAGLIELTELAQRILRAAVNPQGVNIGVNIGRCAGAGVPGHLHVHVLPRWNGDTNFMQTVGQVRVIPQALEESYRHLAQVYAQLGGEKA